MKKRIIAITILTTMIPAIFGTSLSIFAEGLLPEIAETSQNLTKTLSTAIGDASDVENEIQLMSTGTYYPEYGIYFDASTGAIMDTNKSITNINIPDEIDGVAVTSIGRCAFMDCMELINISIPSSIISIGDAAFAGCNNLTNIQIPDSVTSIGSGAFQNCSNLKSATISNNVKSINLQTFLDCRSLTNVSIGNSVTSIGGLAFSGCINLTNILMPSSVINIGYHAFNGCQSLTSITLYNSIKSIANAAFIYCSGLSDIYYWGTEDEWKNVSISTYNTPLANANIHYLYNTSDSRVVNESRYGDINFKVTGVEDTDDLSIKSEPVANATITVNGVTKTTDANGKVGFSKGEITFDGNLVQVSASAEGYLDYKNEIILVAFGDNHISMTKKNPDKIYIANLSATDANGKLYNVMQQNTFTVDKTDTTKYTFKVNMDWNGFDAGKVYLQGAKSGKSFEFVNGEVTVSPGVEFDVGENIRVVAYTADESKSTSKENLLNVIALPEDFSLEIPEASTGHLDCIPFLEGKSFTVGFDKGIEKYAGNVEVKDGKLILDFSDTDNFIQTNKYKIFGENKLSVGPYGKLEIPLYNFQNNDFYGDGEWSGTFGLKTKLTTKAQNSDDLYALIPIVAYNYNTVVMVGTIPVPVTATAAVEGGVKGELEVSGTLEKANFSGTVEPAVGIDLFGGLGQDYDSVEIKAGVYGELVGRLPVSMDFLNDDISFNPSLEGSLGARASVKVYIVDLEGEFEAGKFKWSKDGFTASWLGNEVMLLSLDNDADNAGWQLAGREYLENGGGFIGGNSIALFDLEVTNKDEQIIYNNIFHNAEAILQNINDKDYLIYTIDDIERQEQNGLKLVYSEKLSDGTWSEPTPIDDDGTLDSIISADDKFVAWEDMKSEISASATSMTEIFAQTEISVAYFDGTKWNSTQLTDDDVYDFSPVIKSNGDMAVVAWLSNTESDFTSKSGITNIHYATFDGTNWSEVTTIEDVGAVTRVTAAYDGDTPYAFYKKDGIISSVSVTNGTVTALSYSGVGQYTVDDFNSNVVLAYFDADGDLKVASDAINSSTASTVTTEANVNSIPVIATNDTNMYVGWIDRQDGYDTLCGVRYENGAWSDKITFVGEEANVSNPSLVANDDGTFSASYFKTGKIEVSESGEYTTGEVNLFVNNISPSYNLAIDSETLSYDDEIYARGGGAAMTFDVKNVGEKTVSGFDVEIYENDELKKTISKTTELKAGATTNVYASYVPAESGKVQKLQIKVIPKGVDDFDERDNVAILTLGTIDATVTNAYFTAEGSLNCVNAIIKNNGSANADSITVSVHKGSQDGEVIYQTEIDDVLAYEELLVKTEIPENDLVDTSVFYVTVLAQDDIHTYNDYSIAVKKNDGDLLFGQELAVSVTYDVNTKTATINSNANSSGEVIAAAYQDGRLISIKSKPVDILVGDTPVVFSDLITENADAVKIMIWNNLSTLKPLCDPCVVELD